MDPAVDSARPLNKAVKERNEPCVRVLLELKRRSDTRPDQALLVCAGLQQKSAEADAARVCRASAWTRARTPTVSDTTKRQPWRTRRGRLRGSSPRSWTTERLELAVRGIFGTQSDTRYTPLEVAARGVTGELGRASRRSI